MQFDPCRLVPVSLILAVMLLPGVSRRVAMGQGSRDDYERSASYGRRTQGLVYRDSVRPNWFGEDQDRFWYRVRTGKDSHESVLVDATTGKRSPGYNHKGMTDRGVVPQSHIVRSEAGGSDRTEIRFDNRLSEPLEYFWVMSDGGLRSYGRIAAKSSTNVSTYHGHAWVLKSDSGTALAAFVATSSARLAVIDDETPKPTPKPEQRPSDRSHRRRAAATSPDQRWRVVFDNHNVVVIDQRSDAPTLATEGASESDAYGGRVWWSGDSKHFVVMRTKPGARRTVSMIDSAPSDSIHSSVITIPYAKPGDAIDHPRPVLFHVDDFEPHRIDDDAFSNPYAVTDLKWNDASTSFSFLYNERGHQQMRLISVDAASAQVRVVIDEQSETFVCYSGKSFLDRIDETDEVIWMSERSGWNHLYLIDFNTGRVINAITRGQWVVREVERVDVAQRRIWLKVSGIDPDQDPYHLHLIRVDFDGSNLTRLTEGDGDHRWTFSPDGRFLIDEYSRVDLPPVTELRDGESGELICVLETADARSLTETGWKSPERFVAKGRDGITDIHGIIVRPTSFDPKKRYPVLESIYAGPHSAFVPKRFGRHEGLYAMAELGFIVVKIDGMGTSHRSKAFHDVCWQNLGDSGFPDRIAWIKAAADQAPEMDLRRVGIWGGSAGGQSAMRALIAHGDFYHAAVADCGCHDNRVDKRWWNEQWMGWPIGPHYQEQSNVTGAHRLRGDLMLIVGELDRNVDPASTMQVVDALVRADKDFDLLIMPGVGHGAAGHPYARRRQADFFVRKLWHKKPRHDSPASVPEL